MRIAPSIVLFLFVLCATAHATADVLILDGGDRLQGTITKHDDTTVTLDHSVLGTIELPVDKIKSIDGKPPTVFFAPVVTTTSDDDASTAPAPAKPAAGSGTPDDSKEPVPAPKREWKNVFTLAGSTNSGTSDNASLFMKLQFDRDNDDEKTSISSFYRFASSNGETNQSWYNFTIDQLWKLPQVDTKWQLFAELQFDWSEFNSWEQRLAAHAGGQYPLLSLDKATDPELWYDSLVVNGRIGLGPRKEFAGPDTAIVPEADFGGNVVWTISPRSTITGSADYLPDLLDIDMYRINASLNWAVKLTGVEGLALQLGLTYQFQSQVQAGDKNYDLLTTVGLSYDF